MKPYDKPLKKFVVTVFCIVAGNALLAFLVAAFVIPHDIIMGGTTGIGIVLSRLFPRLDISLILLIINLILIGILNTRKYNLDYAKEDEVTGEHHEG